MVTFNILVGLLKMYAWWKPTENRTNWKSRTDQIQYLRRLVNDFAPFIDFRFFSADVHLFTWSYGKNHIWHLMHLMVKRNDILIITCVWMGEVACVLICWLGFCNCSACEILAAIFPTSSKPNPALFCTISYFLSPRCDELKLLWTVKQP